MKDEPVIKVLSNRIEPDGSALASVTKAIKTSMSRGWHLGGLLYAEVASQPILNAAFGHDTTGRAVETGQSVRWSCTSKLSLAMACARLHQVGLLSFDDRVADHIPAFGANGKSCITIKHLLTHTSGLHEPVSAFDSDNSWSDTLNALCAAAVDREAVGKVAEYSIQTGWFLLAEIVSRAVGMSLVEADLSYGLAPVGVVGVDPFSFSDAKYRPGRSLFGPLAQLVRLCSAFAPGPRPADYLSEDTRREVLRPWRLGIVDRQYGGDLSWGLGLAVDSRLFGMTVSPLAFGHLGAPGTFVVFDPVRDLAVASCLYGVKDEFRATAARTVHLSAVVNAFDAIQQ